jgi:hypothetical protein
MFRKVFYLFRREIFMATGTVKFFNTEKGFGFITPDEPAPELRDGERQARPRIGRQSPGDRLIIFEHGRSAPTIGADPNTKD